jgi:hypothetical protein
MFEIKLYVLVRSTYVPESCTVSFSSSFLKEVLVDEVRLELYAD